MKHAVCLLVTLATVALSALSAPAHAGAEAPEGAGVQTLSTQGGVTRFAFVEYRTPVRSRPTWLSVEIAHLGVRTEDRTDELVVALAFTRDTYGRGWVKVRVPHRPNGTVGWVPQSALGRFHRVDTWLKIDRARLTATLLRRGKEIFRARIGVGKKRWPTPTGQFYVRNKLRGFGPVYGPLAFGTSARSDVLTDWPGGGVIGIHGTDQPELLPGRVSHGCIRLRNRDILRLGRLMPVGTPITIS